MKIFATKKSSVFVPRPIFAEGEPSTIVGAAAFQDSVRDGKSWGHRAPEIQTLTTFKRTRGSLRSEDRINYVS